MNNYVFDTDVKVFCITATSFPEGLPAAYGKLHAEYPPENGRTYFGISYPDGNGGLVYKAAVALNETDTPPGAPYEPFTIRKGTYVGKDIKNFMQDLQSVGTLFRELIALPEIEPNGYCLELYLNPNDVRCMVPLASGITPTQ